MTRFATIVTFLFEAKGIDALKNGLKARNIAQGLDERSEAKIKSMKAEHFVNFKLDGRKHIAEKMLDGGLRIYSVEEPPIKEPTPEEKAARERKMRELAEPPRKPAISIDVFRSLVLSVLAEQQVAREKRRRAKKKCAKKKAEKTNGKVEGKDI